MCSPLSAQTLSKGHRILLERGLQSQALVTTGDVFHLNTCLDGNFTAVHWLWDSNNSLLGAPLGFPWGRWMSNESETLALLSQEAGYLPNMVSLQVGDEQNLNDPAVRASIAAWYNNIRASFPNTILYCNSWGGQITNPNLDDFIRTSQPDMLSFDTYPFRPGEPLGGSPTHFYGDAQRYRKWGLIYGIPYGMYTQTFHDSVTRDASESELRLHYFAGLSFGYKHFVCFTYNTGASSLFTPPGGDSNPKPLYSGLAEINRRIRKLSPALTRLRSTDVRFVNGQHIDPSSGGIVDNARPIDIENWVFGVNDPWLRGWTVTNLGTKNNGLKGDVLLSWFKVLDESFDGPGFSNETYLMVTNGLSAPDGSAADCRQKVKLSFLFGTSGITSMQRLRQDTGKVEVIELPLIPNSGGRRELDIDLDGGTGELFKFNTGAPFVGTSDELSWTMLYDGFDYAEAAALGGRVNPSTGLAWAKGGTGTDAVVSAASQNLSVVGMPGSTGKAVVLSGAPASNAVVDRIGLGAPMAAISKGTLYYSLMLKVTDITGLSETEGGAFLAGFSNSPPTSTAAVTNAGSKLVIRKVAGQNQFQLGIRMDESSSPPTTVQWYSTPFTPGAAVFIVAAYELNKTAEPDPLNDDIGRVWINPHPATLGAAVAPLPSATATGKDIDTLQIQSFFLRQADSGPNTAIADELRMGTTWADVTSSVPCSPPTVTSITPAQGAPGETLRDVLITGTNFAEGVTGVLLTKAGQTDIAAGNVTVTGTGSLTADFALPANAATGSWTVSVTTCTTGTLVNAFRLGLAQDLDGDNDVDIGDVALLASCAGGAGAPYAPSCPLPTDAENLVAADFDRDGDVDQFDFGILQRCLSGADVPPKPGCANP